MKKGAVLDERSLGVLKAIVREYIEAGEPVGSRTLARLTDMNLSAATMRNIMADLEATGLLVSPHASAGRVPSSSGIRLFIDQLLVSTPPNASTVRALRGQLRGDTANDVLESAAQVVSRLTRFAAFVAAPPSPAVIIERLQFVPLSSNRVLTVIVTTTGEVLNRVINCDSVPAERELLQAARLFNRHFSGRTFLQVRADMQSQMLDLRAEIASLLQRMLESVNPQNDGGRIKLVGELNLLNQKELSADVDRLRNLYKLFQRKTDLLELINRGSVAENVRVFVGSECGHEALFDCSVVLSSYGYDADSAPLGFVGVIGPQRMRYGKIISTVDIAAKMVSQMLEQLHLEVVGMGRGQ